MNENLIVKEWKSLRIDLSEELNSMIKNESEHKEVLEYMLSMLESPKTRF